MSDLQTNFHLKPNYELTYRRQVYNNTTRQNHCKAWNIPVEQYYWDYKYDTKTIHGQ